MKYVDDKIVPDAYDDNPKVVAHCGVGSTASAESTPAACAAPRNLQPALRPPLLWTDTQRADPCASTMLLKGGAE